MTADLGASASRALSAVLLLGGAAAGCAPVTCAAGDASADPIEGSPVDAAHEARYDGPFDVPAGPAVTVPLTGCGGPGYAAVFSVGGTALDLTIDTGSATLAAALDSCTNCGVPAAYVPGPAAVDDHKLVSASYLMGSWQGEVYTDSVALDPLDASVTMKFSAIESQTSFFGGMGCGLGTVRFAPEGIVGFGPLNLAVTGTDSFLTKVVQAGIARDVFAVELCAYGGQLMIGGVDPTAAALSGPAAYTPLGQSSYYSVSLTDMSLAGASLGYGGGDFGATAIDTGTSVLALPPAIFDSLSSAVEGSAAFTNAFSGKKGWFGTTDCLTSTVGRAELDAELPPLTLAFPGADGGAVALNLKPTQSYLSTSIGAGGQTYYCSGLYRLQNPTGASTILGTAVMQGHLVIFDREGSRLGFAEQTFCP
ncbi:MAG TPA: pepsin-like aspartic protease [Polyangiaceae bacterium]|jgi:hypothetical protein|nr:pepsin-like aspartic protease [Polyangiaceae bacterium]